MKYQLLVVLCFFDVGMPRCVSQTDDPLSFYICLSKRYLNKINLIASSSVSVVSVIVEKKAKEPVFSHESASQATLSETLIGIVLDHFLESKASRTVSNYIASLRCAVEWGFRHTFADVSKPLEFSRTIQEP